MSASVPPGPEAPHTDPLWSGSGATGPAAAPVAPEPPAVPSRKGLRARIRRRPLAAILVAAFAGLLFGVAIGQSGTVPAERHATVKRQLAGARADLTSTKAKLRTETDRADDAESAVSRLEQRVDDLTAVGDVPDFTGEDVADARESSLVSDLEWKLKT